MKRNDYKKPTIRVVRIQQRQYLLAGSPPYDPGSGGGNGINGAREFHFDWDDSDE
jgi:hypothetical protein